MKSLLLGLSIVLATAGCFNRPSQIPETLIYAGAREPEYGDYTPVEVDALKTAISKISFPAPERTVMRLLPRPLEGLAYAFSDGIATSSAKSKTGGNIMDYWLNRESVLRIATAYYSEGDEHYSMDEWAVILPRLELASYNRDI